MPTLTDPEFVRAFEDCSLPGESFRHREHVRLAWLYLQALDGAEAEASRLVEQGIRRYAAHLGAPHKYHHTITLFWVRAVSAARREAQGHRTFDAFIEARPELLDKTLVERHYSASRLESAAARSGWLDPE